jgi:FemAB-related protein (PEP-CTERM system-associated)
MSPQADRGWDDYVRAHPEGSFFHLSAWREVVSTVFGHAVYPLSTHAGGALKALAPLVEVRSRLFGHALIANAFCVGGGPLASDEAAMADILDRAEHLGRKLGVDYVELRDTPAAGPQWLAKDDLYAGFARSIAPEEDACLKQIPRRQRAVVRKALERGFSVTPDPTPEAFYPLYARTMRDHGTPALPRRYFEALQKAFGEDCEILTVRDGDRPISSVLSYYFEGRVLPYYTGSHPDARGVGSNDLMYWSLMRRALERGCTVFDFGRSKVGTGPHAFKRNWGFEPRPITHQYRLLGRDALPNVNPTNPRYAAFIQVWRQLPMPIANGVAPLLSRSLG